MKGRLYDKWVLLDREIKPSEGTVKAYGRFLAQLLANRGFESVHHAIFDVKLKNILHYSTIPNVEEAVSRIVDAVKRGERIILFGDYDADGITGTAILYDVLSRAKAKVVALLPTRATGYGLNLFLIEKFSKYGELLITVDNGTSAIEEIEGADIDVVVIDHHNAPDELPKKAVLVNPKVREDSHRYVLELSSSAICFYIASLLIKELNLSLDVREYLDYVAIGTVADVVPLNPLNRIFVVKGLELINHIAKGYTDKAGVRSLLRTSGRLENITAKDISYSIAPRINAAGRIHDPKIALELLLERDERRAQALADKLESLNHKRRRITEKVLKEAYTKAKELKDKPFITLWQESWHPGILGIVAGRLARTLGKPTAVFQVSGRKATGSVRSADGIEIYAKLKELSHMFHKWGGHAFAAGITMESHLLPEFACKAAELFEEVSKESSPLQLDMELPLKELNGSVIKEIELLEPYGEGNPYPTFVSEPISVGSVSFSRGKASFTYAGRRVVCWEPGLFPHLKGGIHERRIAYSVVKGDINLIDVED